MLFGAPKIYFDEDEITELYREGKGPDGRPLLCTCPDHCVARFPAWKPPPLYHILNPGPQTLAIENTPDYRDFQNSLISGARMRKQREQLIKEWNDPKTNWRGGLFVNEIGARFRSQATCEWCGGRAWCRTIHDFFPPQDYQ